MHDCHDPLKKCLKREQKSARQAGCAEVVFTQSGIAPMTLIRSLEGFPESCHVGRLAI